MHFDISFISPGEVVKSPRKWLALPGVTCVIAAIAGGSLKLGEVQLPAVASAPRQAALGVVGLILLLGSFVGLSDERADSTSNVLTQLEFWKAAFEAMPPAFIKEYPTDAHIADNQALRTAQGDKPGSPSNEESEVQVLVNADHRRGDTIAAKTGASVQLELSDPIPTRRPQLILTFKKRVNFGERTFIVGWYLPVDTPRDLPRKETMDVTRRREQVLFAFPALAPDDQDPFQVHVGTGVRRRK